MSKVKMRCIVCGKWFQSANAKDLTCPDCAQKARKEKLAAKNAPLTTQKPAGTNVPGGASPVRHVPPPKPKQVQSGTSHWLDTVEDVRVAPAEQRAQPRIPAPPASRENRAQPGADRFTNASGSATEHALRGPAGLHSFSPPGPAGQRPRQPAEAFPGRGPRPEKPNRWSKEGTKEAGKPRGKAKTPRPPAPPPPKKEKTPPPQPFVPTAEQVAQVEARYLELAQPAEFDGIRTQISKELQIPKKAVKKIITALRERQHIPSWWEIQTYKGPPEELERVKELYLPLLPVPPVGVHKQIAEQLSLKATEVYQAIKTIRLEMNLPQYNDPATHEGGLPAKATAETAQPVVDSTSTDELTSDATPEAASNEATPVTTSTELGPDSSKE